ncbi:MAG: GAF domain-containing protein, partial [Candidatus Competibacteraceae bacterium]|nr:GAF domain-containing protein [Candidatus Competibacteraceae bacterium]
PVVTSVMHIMVNGQFDGVVAINLELQRLTETVKRIDPGQSSTTDEKIIIVDVAGQVIAHSENQPLLENVRETLPGVVEVLAGQEGSLTASDEAGSEWLYSYTPVPNAGWGVIVQRSTKQAFASLDTFQRGLVLAFIAFGLGALFFWIVLSQRVINPLVALTRYGQNAIQDTAAFSESHQHARHFAQRSDQIGQLTRAMLQAEENIRRRFLELTTLNKTSAAVTSNLETNQVINSILNEVQNLLSVRQCALLVVNESTQQLELRASRGFTTQGDLKVDLTTADPHMPVLRAIHTNQPVQVPDIDPVSNFLPVFAQTSPEGCRSALVIPITAPHIPPAVLIIYRADVHVFSKEEIDLATSFANHAAIALEHAILFSLTDAELQKQVRSLSALNRVGHTVSQSLVINDVLDNAMGAVLEVMPADACWIYLQRETESFLRLRAQSGLPGAVAERVRDRHIRRNQGVMGQVATSGEPILLEAA